MIAIDIIKSIKSHSISESDKIEIINCCKQINNMSLNVGSDQLIRSILVLTDYNPQRIKELIENKFGGDPRDILVEANNKNPSLNYGIEVLDK